MKSKLLFVIYVFTFFHKEMIFVPWPIQIQNVFLPFLTMFFDKQAHPNPSGNWSDALLSSLRLPNIMHDDVPNKPLDYYTCPFKSNKIDK